MRVVHVVWSLDFGGIGRLVLDLTREQQKNGFEVSVLVGHGHGDMEDEFALSGIPVVNSRLISGFDPGWAKTGRFVGLLHAADIVHVHSYSPTLGRWIQRSKRPVVYTEHGTLAKGRKRTWRVNIKFRMRSKFLTKHVAYITYNSFFTQKASNECVNANKVPRSVVYNGITFDRYESGDSESRKCSNFNKEKTFVIGTTSRFVGFKRIDRLIQAFAGMRDRQNCMLLLVGDGPLRSSYEVLAESLGVANQIEFTGYKANVQDYQSRMDVCVFPSCGEPFGLVALETLALGKPTIVMRDGGGIIEIIEPIEPENIVGGVDGLSRRLEEYRKAWSEKTNDIDIQASRMAYVRKFSVGQMAHKFEDIYSSILNVSSARSKEEIRC